MQIDLTKELRNKRIERTFKNNLKKRKIFQKKNNKDIVNNK